MNRKAIICGVIVMGLFITGLVVAGDGYQEALNRDIVMTELEAELEKEEGTVTLELDWYDWVELRLEEIEERLERLEGKDNDK